MIESFFSFLVRRRGKVERRERLAKKIHLDLSPIVVIELETTSKADHELTKSK